MNLQQAITAYEMQCKGYIFTTGEDNELGARELVIFGQCDLSDYDEEEQPDFEPFVFDGGKVIMVYADNDDDSIQSSPSVVDINELKCWAPVEMNW